ncbi:MAG: serine hydrolase [Isosphaera sp.]|nr:serine hydrolase [Isosphaera sp.]
MTPLLLAAALAAPADAPKPLPVAHGTVDGDIAQAIDRRFAAHTEKEPAFSGVVLFAVDGKVVLAKGYGFADRARKVPFTTDTPFDIGSVTKPFTAAAVLKLEAEGKLKVTDLVSKHLPGVPDDKKDITLHHLLTHTAGLPDALGGDYDPVGRADFVKLALAAKLRDEPGKRYRYSNVGYSLLGAVVEEVTGGGYEKCLREKLFDPAGLAATGYRLPKWDKARVARGYRNGKDWGTPLDHPWADDGPYWHLRANGGLLSTAADLYRWAVALRGDAVLPRDVRDRHLAPQVPEEPGGDTHYAYGWTVRKTKAAGTVVGHNGSNGIFFADLRVYPDRDAVLVFATTGSGLKHLFEPDAIEKVAFADAPKKK